MNQDYIQDIQDIKSIIQERTRFLSLSGLSGILSGLYALVGAFLAYSWVHQSDSIAYSDIEQRHFSPIVMKLLILAICILILALMTSYILTSKKAKARNEKLWTPASKKALKSFAVPLVTGGFFCMLLVWRNELLLIAPTTLVFYGVALYAASQYTIRDVAALGVMEIVLGLCAMLQPGYGIYFWAIGFGILHIIYGSLMYFKYDRVAA